MTACPARTLAWLSGLGAALLAVVSGAPCTAQSFDCTRASTPIENAICASPQLKREDSELAANYRAVLKHIVHDGSKAIVQTQRTWMAERERRCSDGGAECLEGLYRERNAELRALLARTSDENPEIDLADPAEMHGTWVVASGPDQPPAGFRNAQHLPPAGAKVEARPGELCIVNPPDARVCNPFGLAVEMDAAPAKHPDLHLPQGSTLLLVYFNGQADFELAASGDGRVMAIYQQCDSRAENCHWVTQTWSPESADATVKRYHIFNRPQPPQ